MKLLSRQSRALPGVTGVARLSRRSDILLSKLSDGDIAVIDHIDIDRATADALVKCGVTAVINAAPSISGRYPNLGPEILVNSGVILLDDVGDKVFTRLKDGNKIRLDGDVDLSGRRIDRRRDRADTRIGRGPVDRGQGRNVGPTRSLRRQRDRIHEAGADAPARRRRHPGNLDQDGGSAGADRRCVCGHQSRTEGHQEVHLRLSPGADRRRRGRRCAPGRRATNHS